MPNEVVFEVHEAEEGGYYAEAVGYDIITQADSWEDLKRMAQDAVLCHFDGDSVPEEGAVFHFIREQKCPTKS